MIRPLLQPRRRGVVLVILGLAGALAGGWLVARWCFGAVLICESGLMVAFGLFREDGRPEPVRGPPTIETILDYQRQVP